MHRKKSTLLNQLSTADLKRLLAARERIDVLEVEKSRLEKELAKVDGELGKLMTGVVQTDKKVRRKKASKKKTVKKKPGPKKAAAKKVGRKKSAVKKTVRRKSTGKAPVKGKMKLEDVVLAVIRKNGAPVAFQDLKAIIVKGKLFKTKSGNFDNVLRRTLSTSKAVKRVGRGIYDAA